MTSIKVIRRNRLLKTLTYNSNIKNVKRSKPSTLTISPLREGEGDGVGVGLVLNKTLDQYLTSVQVSIISIQASSPQLFKASLA